MEDQPNIYAEYKAKRWQELKALAPSSLNTAGQSEVDRLHAIIHQEAAAYKALKERLDLLTGHGVRRLIFGSARKVIKLKRILQSYFLNGMRKNP